MNALRWSLYPQPLDIPATGWVALSEPAALGEIDFAEFNARHWEVALPIIGRGSVDAIIYWFELDLGEVRINNAPGSALQCIKPAVQYCDRIAVEPAALLPLQIHALLPALLVSLLGAVLLLAIVRLFRRGGRRR